MNKENPKIFLALLLICLLIFSMMTVLAFSAYDKGGLNVSARSAVLYLPEIDEFVFSKNSDQKLPMASTTKIMTALVALENSDPSEVVKVSDDAIGIEGSSAYIKQGEELTMEELLYALLLQSANDAAAAIAIHIGGDIQAFADMMNEKSEDLGLTLTHFENPHGLDSKEHYTTAEELAKITAAAMRNDLFCKIVSTYKKTFATDDRTRTYVNHNKLLKLYDGAVGVKTGFTKKSGRCLVGAAERDGLTFISVTLDAPSDWSDHKAMLDYGFDCFQKIKLTDSFEQVYNIPVIGGKTEYIKVANDKPASIILDRTDHNISEYIKLNRYAVAPINKGDILGEIIYTVDGMQVSRVTLTAMETVEKKKDKGLFEKILSIFDR